MRGSCCAAAYFGAHGIPRIERLITDNAFAYRHSTAVKQCAQLGAKHNFIKPHCPWQNGKVCEDLARRCIEVGLTPAKV